MPPKKSLQLKKYLPQHILNLLQTVGKRSSDSGEGIFLVGGAVRDLFLGRANFDLDLVVEGDAIELAQELAKNIQAKLIAHHRFGTATFKFADFNIDIATARRESYSRPGALPDVESGTIADDLFRRDFSINAMALSLMPERFGELIDLYHGKEDIQKRFIRILHQNSFRDDATRIFRAIRYEQRLDFTIEPHTDDLLRRDVAMLKTVSGDRIRHELMLILMEEFPERVLSRAAEFGVLSELNQSLTYDAWLGQKFEQARQLQKRTSLCQLYLCLLVYHLTESENEQFLTRLNFPKKFVEAIPQTLQLKAQLKHLAEPELKPSDIYQLLHNYVPLAIQANMLAVRSRVIKQYLRLYLIKLQYTRPLLNGEDLKRIGVSPGPELGKILKAIHEAKLNGQVRTRKGEEKLVRSWLGVL